MLGCQSWGPGFDSPWFHFHFLSFLFDSNVSMKPSLIGLYGERLLKLSLIRIVRIQPDQLQYLSVLKIKNSYNGQQVLTVSPRWATCKSLPEIRAWISLDDGLCWDSCNERLNGVVRTPRGFRPCDRKDSAYARAIWDRQYIGGHPHSSIHYEVNMSVPIYCPSPFSSNSIVLGCQSWGPGFDSPWFHFHFQNFSSILMFQWSLPW